MRVAGLGFLVSFALAVVAGLILRGAGFTKAPLLVAIMLSPTSLGVVIPVLKDTGQSSTRFGQLVLAGASIADVATIVLLSLFFSEKSSGVGAKLVLGGFVAAHRSACAAPFSCSTGSSRQPASGSSSRSSSSRARSGSISA